VPLPYLIAIIFQLEYAKLEEFILLPQLAGLVLEAGLLFLQLLDPLHQLPDLRLNDFNAAGCQLKLFGSRN